MVYCTAYDYAAGKEGTFVINESKVSIMTKLALEEKEDVRMQFTAGRFWTSDYLISELWKTFFVVTAGYAVVWAVWLAATSDTWTVTYHIRDVLELAKTALIGYAAVLPVGLLISIAFHTVYYLKAYRKMRRIRNYYRALERMYREEEQLSDIIAGRAPEEPE